MIPREKPVIFALNATVQMVMELKHDVGVIVAVLMMPIFSRLS